MGQATATRGGKSSGLQNSDQKRNAKAIAGSGNQYNFSLGGEPQTVQVQQDNFFTQGKNIRDGKKKASKLQAISVNNWLETFNTHKYRPSREILERSIHLTRYYCRFVL